MNFISLLGFIIPFSLNIPFQSTTSNIATNHNNVQSGIYNLVDHTTANNYKYSAGITSTLHNDFNIEAENNTISIYKTFFTQTNDCILFVLNKQHNNFSHKSILNEQYFNTILYLDRQQKAIITLLKIESDIKSINFNQQRNVIFFITNNQVSGYKLSDNKQLTEICKVDKEFEVIDISLNYDASLLAIAFKSNRLTIFKLPNDKNDKVVNSNYREIYHQLAIKKIVSINFSATENIIAIENTNNIKTSIILFELTKDNQLGSALYDVPGSHHIIKYAITPIEKQIVLQTMSTVNDYNSNKPLKIVGEKNYIDYYPNPISKINLNFNETQIESNNVLDFTVCENKDTVVAIKRSASNETVLYFISVYQDQYNFQIITKNINGKNYHEASPSSFYPYYLQYQKSQEVFTDANSVSVNKDGSEIAVIGNNRIQIYDIKYSMLYKFLSKLDNMFFLLVSS